MFVCCLLMSLFPTAFPTAFFSFSTTVPGWFGIIKAVGPKSGTAFVQRWGLSKSLALRVAERKRSVMDGVGNGPTVVIRV